MRSAASGWSVSPGATSARVAAPSGPGVHQELATRISLAATLLMGLYVALTMPPDPMARVYGAVAVLATYIIVRRIASRVAMETMK